VRGETAKGKVGEEADTGIKAHLRLYYGPFKALAAAEAGTGIKALLRLF
jgi:hypothetical protein